MRAIEQERETVSAAAPLIDMEMATGWLEEISGMIALGFPPMQVQSFIHRNLVVLGELREAYEEGRL